MTEEYRRWGSDAQGCDTRAILREEAEYAQADAITVPSEFSRRSFIEMGVPESRVYKIPYGVNLQRFQPVGKPPQDSFEVLFAGQVGFRKGIPYLLQAFEKLSHPRKRLRIVGGLTREIGPFLAKHLPVGVEILGLIPQSELRQIMSSSHVMVLPSIEEGLALVQGQAMACGCPLISSTNTGGSDLFTPGVEGFEVPIRSADAIAERLQQLADEPLLQQKMGQAALERVKTLGGWRDYGEQYLSLLEQLVSASAGV
jgi:glycosyltransferase involved in cell wall biosynthesis